MSINKFLNELEKEQFLNFQLSWLMIIMQIYLSICSHEEDDCYFYPFINKIFSFLFGDYFQIFINISIYSFP
ncbi:hypothetical protein BpHYR1_024427 [Brachionus plicatilis]|uniref:Uncharacterized protein n=1 Tax=Brachionus plicatilis TaxID=10195 RepID=A0A3M7QTA1_BRAPC|nr:hypothetical protein BpHYR1_024427 [Brachionus plicatilis]